MILNANHEATASTAPVMSKHATGDRILMPHHAQELVVGSGIRMEFVKAAGIYSEWDPARLGRLLKIDEKMAKKKVPAIVFPFTRADGSNDYSRCKPDRPNIDRKGRKVKYESPRNEPNEIYLPPGVAQYLANPQQELLITEGEKKALAATDAGFPCIGITGVYCWKVAKKERLLPELEKIAWQGRRVFIGFDSDEEEKPEVMDAGARLAAALSAQGAIVRRLIIPHGIDAAGESCKQGLDDFLVAHGDDGKRELRRLIDEAVEPTAPNPDAMKQAAKELDPADESRQFLEASKKDDVYKLRNHRGGFVLWTEGRYTEIQVGEVRARMVNFLNDHYHHLTSNIVGNCLEQLRAQALLPFGHEPPCWIVRPEQCDGWEPRDLLATRDTIVHLPTGKTIAATPRYFTPAALTFDFVPNAAEPTEWLKFLNQIWEDDPESIETLGEFMGLCLVPDTSLQKILMVIGPRRSGKGTIARVLQAIVGAVNCCGPTMSSLAQNFGLQALLHKTVAIISDARLSGRTDSGIVVERLLSISGEDSLTIDIKHREPVTAKLLTRLLIFSNELPRLADPSGALSGRFIGLRMTKSFYGTEDRLLTDKLMEERAGILCWAIKGLKRLRQRGYLIEPASFGQLRQHLDDFTSPVGQFIRERCQLGGEYEEEKPNMYKAYMAWALAGGAKPAPESAFARDLYAACTDVRSVRPRQDDGSRVHCYGGIRLLPAELG